MWRSPAVLTSVALIGLTLVGPASDVRGDAPPLVALHTFHGAMRGESGRETRQAIVWATIPIRDPRIEVVVTPPEHRGITVREFARRHGTEVAVNANYYDAAFSPCGLVAAAGRIWPLAYHHTPAGRCADSLGFTADGRARFFDSYPRLSGPLPRGIVNVVSGMPRVLRSGRVVSAATLGSPGYPRNLLAEHPRTGLGVTRDGNTLIIAVVDGRSEGRDGMTARELGRWMRDMGCHDAILLDGGGSSALVAMGRGVVNRTPTGGERAVGVHFGVRIRPQ